MAIGPRQTVGTSNAELLEHMIDARIVQMKNVGSWCVRPIPENLRQKTDAHHAYHVTVDGHASVSDKAFLEARYVNAGWNGSVVVNTDKDAARLGLVLIYLLP
jgi:hypothetical protein